MKRVDIRRTRDTFKQLKLNAEQLAEGAHKVFVENTPRRTGNARRNTDLQGTTIVADYAYSQRLDQGYSRQSPKGMVEPTEQWIQQEVERQNRGL